MTELSIDSDRSSDGRATRASGPSGSMHDGQPEAVYGRLRDRYESEARELRRRSTVVGRGRLATFFAAAACLAPALVGTDEPRLAWLAAAGVLVAAFLALVAWDERLGRRIRRLETLRDVNARSLARRAVDLRGLAPCPPVDRLLPGADDLPPFARDLYLFGDTSLFRLLSTAHTPTGRGTLARWLVEPPGPSEVARRQEAVRTLAGDRTLGLRQELEARAVPIGEESSGKEPDLERFYAWAEGEPWLSRRPVRLWTARALTLLVPASLGAAAAGVIPWSLFGLVALVSYLVSATATEQLHAIYDRATAGGDGLRGYGPVFRVLEGLDALEGVPPQDEPSAGARPSLLAELADRLHPAGRSERRWAADWMDRLERLTVLSDIRRGVGHIIVQVLFLWDFHLATRFEAWQRDVGPSVRGWLEALGEVEALASLAALAHAHPEWSWPRVGPRLEPDEESLVGRALGHPLIPPGRRVDNDVRLGPPGTFLLVTGSNMSGKTTLLRAVGTNVVLAQAGGPVCAGALSMPPVRLATSVVVEDSLADGVSFFMAELLRLKGVVEAAEEEAGRDGGPGEEGGRRLLYLLDEVLRGTNSAERRVAIRRVLRRLLELGAIGAVTTHDLELTRPDDDGAESLLEEAAETIHFRETVHPRAGGGAEMTFDFVARPGLAPTTNALRLLEAVGLGGEEP